MASIYAILGVGEVLQRSNLVEVIFNLLNNTWCTIFAEIVHAVEGFKDSSPLLWLALHLLPEMLHDHIIVLPVVCMVGKHLELAIRYVPVLIGSGLTEDSLELRLLEKATALLLPAPENNQKINKPFNRCVKRILTCSPRHYKENSASYLLVVLV